MIGSGVDGRGDLVISIKDTGIGISPFKAFLDIGVVYRPRNFQTLIFQNRELSDILM
jgi:hypothetical protein